MARPLKRGLDYFPLDVDFFQSDEIAFVSARFLDKGELIAVKLLCKIYKNNGYYLKWSEDEAILFATRVVGDSSRYALVNDVVHELIKRSFFDKTIFDSFKVLTSAEIQRQYFAAVERRKEVPIIKEYLLITLPVNINVVIYSVNGNINPVKTGTNTQTKLNKTKPNNFKRNDLMQFFEIFFFKNFIDPQKEVDKFINHYSRSGWKDANGNPIFDPVAAAHNWEQRTKKDQSPPFAPLLLEQYKQLYEAVKKQSGEKSAILLQIQKLLVQGKELHITCSRHTAKQIETDLISDNRFGQIFLEKMKPLTRLMYTFTD